MTQENDNLAPPEGKQLELVSTPEKVRPEYNIAKFANFLFISPYSKKAYEERNITFASFIENEEIKSSIRILPAKGRKTPTTTEQKVLYALFQIWEDRGKPENGEIIFSSREVAKILGIKWNGKFARRLDESLEILKVTAIRWVKSFDEKDEKKTRHFEILDEYEYYERDSRLKREKFTRLNLVKFDKSIIFNLLNGKTKPYLFKEMLSIKIESAIVLYTALDVYLSNTKSKVRELKATRIIRELLYLDGERYAQKKIRKQELLKLIKALNGKRISNGAVLDLSIRESVDKSDWVLVARAKYPVIKIDSPKKEGKKVYLKPVNDDKTTQLIIEDIRQATGIKGEDEPLNILAKYYSFELINHALSVYKADYRGTVRNPMGLFQGILHGITHKAGKEWIFGCGKDCKHRPENSPQQKIF